MGNSWTDFTDVDVGLASASEKGQKMQLLRPFLYPKGLRK